MRTKQNRQESPEEATEMKVAFILGSTATNQSYPTSLSGPLPKFRLMAEILVGFLPLKYHSALPLKGKTLQLRISSFCPRTKVEGVVELT